MRTSLSIICVAAVILSGCGMADLRSSMLKQEGVTAAAERKGRQLLDRAWKAQGLDRLREHRVYAVEGEDHWKGVMGRMSKVWPEARAKLKFQYAINTFDGRVEFLNGKRRGDIAGLQSWRYYEQEKGGELVFKDKRDSRISFGLAAFQYFFELADRSREAPIVVYAGEKAFDGKTYDQILVTWKTIEPHKQHDQYRLWLDRETGMIAYFENTVREVYMPGGGMFSSFYGSVRMADFRAVDGVQIPHEMSVYIKGPKKDLDAYVHRLTVADFRFDSFDESVLYPDPELGKLGDAKL